MSVKVSSWVWHGDETAGVAGNEMILLLALADVADDNGRCRYADDEVGLTYDALAVKARVDRRTIERLIPKLRERGLVAHVKGAKGRANEFAIAVPWAQSSTDSLSGNESQEDADSPTAVQDSPTAGTTFPDSDDIRTSIQRINVTTRNSSPVGAAVTKGVRFAEPLCNVLSAELLANGVKHTVSKVWLADARLLVDRDERDPHEAKALIEWACHDSFWRSNILSMPTFRKQYDKLRLARERAGVKPGTVDAGRQADAILRAREGDRQAIAS
jgi:hypothetical protein